MMQEADRSSVEAAAWLRDAWGRTAGMSAAGRKKAIGVCLAYRLRGLSHEQAEKAASAILQTISGRAGTSPTGPGTAATATLATGSVLSESQLQRLRAVVALLGGTVADDVRVDEILSAVERSAHSLVDEVYRVGDNKRFLNVSPENVLRSVEVRLRHGDDASKLAAQEMFDRLLKSVDPVAAKDYVEEKGLRFGPFHKAALYDAVCEKFAQMSEYHEKGRLVRDFRAMYRSRLAELAKSEDVTES